MNTSPSVNIFKNDMDAIFKECEQNIQKAIREYEKDISGALEHIKRDCLSRMQS